MQAALVEVSRRIGKAGSYSTGLHDLAERELQTAEDYIMGVVDLDRDF